MESSQALAAIRSEVEASTEYRDLENETKTFYFGSNKKKVPYHSPKHFLSNGEILRVVICHLFLVILGQSEKNSDIKQPLALK